VKEISLAECQFLGGPFGGIVVKGFDYLESNEMRSVTCAKNWKFEVGQRGVYEGITGGRLTFFGGKMAMADLGVMEIW
jgi:hypothetical protein